MQQPIDFGMTQILMAVARLGWPDGLRKALTFTLPAEGLIWEQVGGDPGGATCCGITQADYNAYRQENNEPLQPVLLITATEVAAGYKHHYWDKMQCDKFMYPLALVLFDTAVNVGVEEASKQFERVLGIPADGVIGPDAEANASQYVAAHGLILLTNADIARRTAFYEEIGAPGKELNEFLEGWVDRDEGLQKTTDAAAAALAPPK